MCVNGTVDGSTFYTCKCNAGFAGKYCQSVQAPTEQAVKYAACPRDPAAAAGSSESVCYGHGECVTRTVGTRTIQQCRCAAPVADHSANFFGFACNISQARTQDAQDAVVARNSMEDKIREAKTSSAACTGAAPFHCPNVAAIFGDKADTCAASLTACRPDGTAARAAAATQATTLRTFYAAARTNKTAFASLSAAQLSECGLLLAPVKGCDRLTEKKCADGSCVLQAADCAVDLDEFVASACPDAGSPVLCADGSTCAANRRSCARLVPASGCDAGTRPCPSNPSKCAASLAACASKIGCAAGTTFCGYQRVNGVAVLDSGSTARGKPICKAQCAAPPARDPKPVTTTLAAEAVTAIPVTAAESDRVCFKMTCASRAIKSRLDPNASVAISIDTVPDTWKREGPFKAMESSGSILSPMIKIEADAEVDLVGGGVEVEFAINDETASESLAACTAVLANAAVMSVEDAGDLDATAGKVAVCVPRWSADGGCNCALNLTHFSVYTVNDEAAQASFYTSQQQAVAEEVSDEGSSAETAAATSADPDAATAADPDAATAADSDATAATTAAPATPTGAVVTTDAPATDATTTTAAPTTSAPTKVPTSPIVDLGEDELAVDANTASALAPRLATAVLLCAAVSAALRW